jgi:hypothetical protein
LYRTRARSPAPQQSHQRISLSPCSASGNAWSSPRRIGTTPNIDGEVSPSAWKGKDEDLGGADVARITPRERASATPSSWPRVPARALCTSRSSDPCAARTHF